jgi:hypothetical protein
MEVLDHWFLLYGVCYSELFVSIYSSYFKGQGRNIQWGINQIDGERKTTI